METSERRRYPRLKDERIPVKLKSDDFDLVAHTLDISASGLYCKVEKEIPLMTRLKLVLMIPDPSGRDKEAVTAVETSGVVVREHPVIINGQTRHYDVAIFFDDLSGKNRQLISEYVVGRDH